MDLQKLFDDWLANHPEYAPYIERIYFVPDGGTPPEGTTHLVRLSARTADERALTIALVIADPYATMLDALLALVATQ